MWVEKIKTKSNVGIHGNIKSWLWVEYIASTGVRIIIVIVVCWGTYVRIIIIVLCWGTMKIKTYFFNFLRPLYKPRLRILINVFLEIVILHSFCSPSHLKKILINNYLSLAVWAVFKLAFLKGRNWGNLKHHSKMWSFVFVEIVFFGREFKIKESKVVLCSEQRRELFKVILKW